MITHEIFYNKELADCLRDVSINSLCILEDAIDLLKDSRNLTRDSEIVMKLKDAGIPHDRVKQVIQILNK